MPRCGYTSITVPVELKDRLKEVSSSSGYNSVPQMIETWMLSRTGTVQVQPRALSSDSILGKRINSRESNKKRNDIIENINWCDCRESNPGRLRGRQKSYL